MKKSVQNILSAFLIVAFVFAITPKEFIHAFSDHQDTVDYHTGAISVGTNHIHCQILQLQIQQFRPSDKIALSAVVFLNEAIVVSASNSIKFITEQKVFLRGPPGYSC
ncbi:MAG: hypothetical protein H0W62_15050 [Chitinophagales bacterium]|nr:hypothetical protein [Chitinophagales bacterium]